MNDAREPRPRTEDRGLENHDGSDCPSRRGANYGIASPLNFHDSFTALSPRRVATARVLNVATKRPGLHVQYSLAPKPETWRTRAFEPYDRLS
jgi:hypothetical protein